MRSNFFLEVSESSIADKIHRTVFTCTILIKSGSTKYVALLYYAGSKNNVIDIIKCHNEMDIKKCHCLKAVLL